MAQTAHAATITVDTTTDVLDGASCSLRQAIQTANSHALVGTCTVGTGTDTIILPAGTHALTFDGPSEDNNEMGDLDVKANITLQGADKATTIIDGNGTDRVLTVFATFTVSLSAVTVRNGWAPPTQHGGGILNGGTLTLNDVIVSTNHAGLAAAGNGGSGGGIYNTGTLTVIGSTVTQNTAGDAPDFSGTPDGGSGGGIANTGTLTVTGGSIDHNTSGVAGYDSPGGGAVSNLIGATATLQDVHLDQNTAGGLGSGGAVYNQGTITVSRCTMNGNTGALLGGALAARLGVATVTGCLISGNSASYAGALSASNTTTATTINLTNSTVVGNTSSSSQGTIEGQYAPVTIHISHSTIVNNSGGVWDPWGTSTWVIRNSILSANTGATCTLPGGAVVTYSIFPSGGSCPAGATNLTLPSVTGTVVDPTLVNKGGPTLVAALRPGSPAINAGTCTDATGAFVPRDQRGYSRPSAGDCDIGAVELQVLTRIITTEEPPGANCSTGGQRFDAGIDADEDLALSPQEISSTYYVCNGSNGTNGAAGTTALSSASVEAPGANCGSGGWRILTGSDTDDDATLDDAEVTNTAYVCDGAAGAAGTSGANALLKVTPLAAGTQCAAGGQTVTSGIDTNGNGVLDESETTNVATLCDAAKKSGGCASTQGSSALLLLALALPLLRARRRAAR